METKQISNQNLSNVKASEIVRTGIEHPAMKEWKDSPEHRSRVNDLSYPPFVSNTTDYALSFTLNCQLPCLQWPGAMQPVVCGSSSSSNPRTVGRIQDNRARYVE
jgi:hypothetical protein